jgi:thiamine kinase-like enzyme
MTNTKEIVDIFLSSEITNISDPERYSISKLGGITNNNFKVGVSDRYFVLRLPGKNPDLINRKAEKINQTLAAEAGLTLPFLYFDENTGIKISDFESNLIALEPDQLKSKEYINTALITLKELHQSNISFVQCFDHYTFFKEIYKEEEYKEMAEIGNYLLEKIKAINQKLVPCHKDIYGPNFVLLGDDMYLIDWEYSGMESKFSDYGDLCLQQNIEEVQRKELFVELELEEGGDDQVLWNLYRYLSSLTWGLWSTRKGVLNEETDKDYLDLGKNKIKYVFEAVNTENFEKHFSRKY